MSCLYDAFYEMSCYEMSQHPTISVDEVNWNPTCLDLQIWNRVSILERVNSVLSMLESEVLEYSPECYSK